MAAGWARSRGIEKVTAVKADWDTHGKQAGYLRNIAMADMDPEMIIAFPGGKGTMMMKGIGLKRGIEVLDHYEIL